MIGIRRYEITDLDWSIIQPLLPNKPRGKYRVDDRRALNAIYWRLRTGSQWDEIPERYGPPTSCSNRFRRWARIGVWDRVSEAVSAPNDGDTQMLDSTYQHGGNVSKGRLPRQRPLGTRLERSAWGLARRADD